MLQTLLHTLSNTLQISVTIGQWIFFTLRFLLTWSLYLAQQLGTLLLVIYEDFFLFLNDFQHCLLYIYKNLKMLQEASMAAVIMAVQGSKTGFQFISSTVEAILNELGAALLGVSTGLQAGGGLVKDLFYALGDGLWFLVVFLPKSFTYFLQFLQESVQIANGLLRQYSGSLLTGALYIVANFTLCLIGLLIALSLLYLIFQIYRNIISAVQRKFMFIFRFCRAIYRHVRRVLGAKFRGVRSQRPSAQLKIQRAKTEEEANVTLCVICQDRLKCILTLPCKHVCLCMECYSTLRRYDNQCPICRNCIHQSMKIYL